MTSTSRAISLGALLFIAVTSLFIALLFGSVPLSAPQILTSLFSSTPGIDHDIVWKLRLPRALAAFACGGLLAISGVLLQVLLRNPLADPYVLGVSGGAALGALVALLLGAGGAAFLHLGALAGAFAAIAIVFALSFRAGDWNVHRLLLTGIVLSAGFTALISLLLVLAPQVQLRGMLFWLMGDLSDADNSTIAWIVLALVLALFIAFARNLDVLALGSLKARALGVAVAPLQAAIYFGAALLGGSFVVLADTLARAAWAPQQLPVGVFTALIGVPALLILLSRKP